MNAAKQELARLARANAAFDWRLSVWLDGARGGAEAKAWQNRSAALFFLARNGLGNKLFLNGLRRQCPLSRSNAR